MGLAPGYEKYAVTCIKCGTGKDLVMMPHRNVLGLLVGYLFVCLDCWPSIAGGEIHVVKREGE